MKNNPALKWGLIFGLALAIIQVIFDIITNVIVRAANIGLIVNVLSLLIGIVAYLVVGLLAARETGKVSTGTLAGLWGALFYGVIGLVSTLIITFTRIGELVRRAQITADQLHLAVHYTPALIIGGAITAAVLGLAFTIGLGAGLGALGGLIGKGMAKVPPPPTYQETYYQGMPPISSYGTGTDIPPPMPPYSQPNQPMSPYGTGTQPMPPQE